MIRRWLCRRLGHKPEPALDKKDRLYIRCQSCGKDLS